VNGFFSKGLVLAFNAVPVEVDADIVQFWETLSLQLQNTGMHLIVAETTPLPAESFFTIPIHYHITDLYHEKGESIELEQPSFIVPDEIIASFSIEYGYDLITSRKMINLAIMFYSELIDSLKPAVLMGWQSNDITTYIVRNISMQRGIPCWSVERGFIKSTLMMDTGDNYAQSELLTSMTIENIYNNYSTDHHVWEALKYKVLHPENRTGKYRSAPFKNNKSFRFEYAIPEKKKLVAIFNHGPLGLAVKHEDSHYRIINRMHTTILLNEIHDILRECIKREMYVIYQEHPLSIYDKTGIELPDSPFIIKTDENIHTLLNSADYYFFTHSTIQYEAAFYGKPIALLSRSMLGYHGGVYAIEDFENTNDFLNAVFSDVCRDENLKRSQKWLSFIYQYFLIKNDNESRENECLRISKKLQRYSRPVNADVIFSLRDFVQRWG